MWFASQVSLLVDITEQLFVILAMTRLSYGLLWM